MPDTNVICLCPAKNEAWVMRPFIECASKWADYIIIGDHNSTDDTAKIAREYSHVKVVDLTNPAFDAGARRKVLMDEARKIPGKRLIFSVDADEMISSNWSASPEWDQMKNAEPGTTFHFDWLYVLPGIERAYVMGLEAAFIDDGTEYVGSIIAEPRTSCAPGKMVWLRDIKLLHYVNIDPERMLSKQRWYKCFELMEKKARAWAACVHYPAKDVRDYGLPVVPVEQKWVQGYDWLDDFRGSGPNASGPYWWDGEVLKYFNEFGVERFRQLDIWDVDWNSIAKRLGIPGNFRDPRAAHEVWVHRLIERNWNQLKQGQASEKFVWRLWYMAGRVGLRPLGW